MTPSPLVNQAYAMIINNEGQKSINFTSSDLLETVPHFTHDPTVLYSRMSTQKSKKDYSLQCKYCKLKGHSKENCRFYLIDYPQF